MVPSLLLSSGLAGGPGVVRLNTNIVICGTVYVIWVTIQTVSCWGYYYEDIVLLMIADVTINVIVESSWPNLLIYLFCQVKHKGV